MGKNEFSDILNAQGFKATSDPETGSQSLKSLKKEQDKPDDPIQAKVTLVCFFIHQQIDCLK